MRKTLDLWILLAAIVALVAGFGALKAALPYVLDFVRASALLSFATGAFLTGMWAVHRRGRWRSHRRDLLQTAYFGRYWTLSSVSLGQRER